MDKVIVVGDMNADYQSETVGLLSSRM